MKQGPSLAKGLPCAQTQSWKLLEQGSSHPSCRPDRLAVFLKMQMSGPCSPEILMKSTQAWPLGGPRHWYLF